MKYKIIYIIFSVAAILIFQIGCKKTDKENGPAELPVVTTLNPTDISQSTAKSGGEVVSDGGGTVTVSGICWSDKPNPTPADFKTTNGPQTGTFTSNLTKLDMKKTYYLRAYATNKVGTAYGAEVSFTTTAAVAVLSTTPVTELTGTTAKSGGNITEYGETVTARGICWSLGNLPTINDSKAEAGTGGGSFSANLTGLTPGMTYRVRAYAVNVGGVGYGEVIKITTPMAPITDHDGNVYNSVRIGNQVWMTTDLKVTHFRNGDPITDLDKNDPYNLTRGMLYTWHAAADGREIAPSGWHVPTDAEWTQLEQYLGAGSAGRLKGVGTAYWDAPNVGATDDFGFAAGGNGINTGGGRFAMGSVGIWWSSTASNASAAWRRDMDTSRSSFYRYDNDKSFKFSIRLIKD